jgi:hypothetical protein
MNVGMSKPGTQTAMQDPVTDDDNVAWMQCAGAVADFVTYFALFHIHDFEMVRAMRRDIQISIEPQKSDIEWECWTQRAMMAVIRFNKSLDNVLNRFPNGSVVLLHNARPDRKDLRY